MQQEGRSDLDASLLGVRRRLLMRSGEDEMRPSEPPCIICTVKHIFRIPDISLVRECIRSHQDEPETVTVALPVRA